MKKGLSFLLIVFVSFLVIIVATLVIVPKIIPAYVEKNSQEMLGRQVRIGKVNLNFIKLQLKVTNFTLYELNGTDVFVSFDEFNVDLKLISSLRGNYTLSSMLLDNLKVNVEFDGEHFNFDDLLVDADTAMMEEPVDTTDELLQFTLNNVELRRGHLVYYDSHEDIRHELSNVGFVLPHFSWDNDQSSEMDLAFKFEPQGVLKLKADIDSTKKHYQLRAQIIDLALAPFSVYLGSVLASQGLDGMLNNTIYVKGAMDDPTDVVISGKVEVSDFLLKDDKGEPIFENALLGVYLDSIDPKNSYYGIRKILISEPQVYAALYDTTTNFNQLMKPLTDAMALADTLPEEELELDTTAASLVYFKIDTFQLSSGAIYLVDNTLNRPFKYNVTSINTEVFDVNPKATEVPVSYSLDLNKAGQLVGNAHFSMLNSEEIEYSAQLKGLNLTSFSPYSEYYIARPIKRGNFNFKGKALMSEMNFSAENQIHINDIELGEKTDDEAQVKLPVRLALGILKDKDGDVNFDVPMEGDPSDPDFNIGKIVAKTLSDFIVKIAAAPFAIVGDIVGVDPERLKEIPLECAVSSLGDGEKETLNQIALALNEKPELEFHFTLETSMEIEKEALAISHLKRDYLRDIATPEENVDSVLSLLSVKDTALVAYANEKTDTISYDTFGEQCRAIVGEEDLVAELFTLSEERKAELMEYLLVNLNVDSSSVDVKTMDDVNHIIDIDKSRYRVELSVK